MLLLLRQLLSLDRLGYSGHMVHARGTEQFCSSAITDRQTGETSCKTITDLGAQSIDLLRESLTQGGQHFGCTGDLRCSLTAFLGRLQEQSPVGPNLGCPAILKSQRKNKYKNTSRFLQSCR